MRTQIRGRFAAFPDFELEAYLCAELPAERRAALERAIAADASLRAYLAERAQTRSEFAAAHPLRLDLDADDLAREPRMQPAPWLSPRRWLVAAGVAAPALVLALFWSSGSFTATAPAARTPDSAPFERDAIRIKGSGLAAELYVKRGERVFRPRPDEALQAGDRVRLSVDAARSGYLTLLARDEHGAVSVYYDRLPVQAGRFTAPDSLLLDASPGDELWLVVVAGEPRPADHYARAFAAGQPPDATHVLLTLHKEKP